MQSRKSSCKRTKQCSKRFDLCKQGTAGHAYGKLMTAWLSMSTLHDRTGSGCCGEHGKNVHRELTVSDAGQFVLLPSLGTRPRVPVQIEHIDLAGLIRRALMKSMLLNSRHLYRLPVLIGGHVDRNLHFPFNKEAQTWPSQHARPTHGGSYSDHSFQLRDVES
jgi:hypothetical protein